MSFFKNSPPIPTQTIFATTPWHRHFHTAFLSQHHLKVSSQIPTGQYPLAKSMFYAVPLLIILSAVLLPNYWVSSWKQKEEDIQILYWFPIYKYLFYIYTQIVASLFFVASIWSFLYQRPHFDLWSCKTKKCWLIKHCWKIIYQTHHSVV